MNELLRHNFTLASDTKVIELKAKNPYPRAHLNALGRCYLGWQYPHRLH